MNVVCLMGRLTTDPELKTTANGNSVTSFTLAVDRAYTPKGEDKKTDFIDCVAWQNTAEFITRYFRKGQRMSVKGELNKRTYTANDGGQRSVYEVKVDNAYFCESKNNTPAVQQNTQQFEEIPVYGDIPF
jgi:single-strand DNA-binding protein